MRIQLRCVRCRKDEGLQTDAVIIFNGTSLCKRHLDVAQEEIFMLEEWWNYG